MTGSGVLQSVPVPVILTDKDALVEAMNPAAQTLFDEQGSRRAFVTLLRNAQVNAALDSVLAGRDERRELRVTISPRGREISADVYVVRYGVGAAVTIIDRSALDSAEAMRRDFVANVSHELRTPLTALLGFIETLRGPARDDASARDRFLGIMEREAGRMNRLVDDLLSLSRVESEERRLPSERIDLSALLSGAVQTLRPATEAAGMKLVLTGADQPLPISADADQITQVFQNLIENAIKYGAGGEEVRVEIHPVQHEPVLRGPAVRVDVIDQGEGIDQIHLPRLTERFYRVDTHRSREKGGTGLGLAIVKHIINRHRGRFRVHSIPGNGSRFSVMLPADKTPGGE